MVSKIIVICSLLTTFTSVAAVRVDENSDAGPQSQVTESTQEDDQAQPSARKTQGEKMTKLDSAVLRKNTPNPTPIPTPELSGIQSCVSDTDPHGCHWKDTKNERIEAHGGGILQYNGTIYWYGENRKNEWGKVESPDEAITLYKSDSFDGPWESKGVMLRVDDVANGISHDGGLTYDVRVLERPKVLFCENTKKFVMYLHIDDEKYLQRQVGIATSDSPEGPFHFQKRLREDHGMPYPSLDMSIWKDPVTKNAFFIRDTRIWRWKDKQGFGKGEFHKWTILSLLTDDYLSIKKHIKRFPIFEGMAIFYETPNWPKYEENPQPGGRYWIVGSPLDGWQPHDLIVWYSEWGSQSLDKVTSWNKVSGSITGGDSTAFRSQPTYISRTYDRNGDQYFIYHADNWILGATNDEEERKKKNLPNAGYVWLPFNVNNGNLKLKWRYAWSAKTIEAGDM